MLQRKSIGVRAGMISAAALLSVLGVTGSVTGAQAATSGKMTAPIGKPVYGGTLSLDLAQDFPSLDPAIAYDPVSYEGVDQMFNELVTYSKSTNNIVPDLATWKISPDGKVYTFHIKPATFWNGDAVNAQSFITEFERVLNPKTASPGQGFIESLIEGAQSYTKGTAKTVSGLKAVNASTLQVTLTHPDSTFLFISAMPFFAAVDTNYYTTHSDSYVTTHPMGSGPFELQSYAPGAKAVFVKNPHYFKVGLPYLSKLVYTVDNSPQSVLYHFEQGQTDLISRNQSGIPSADYLPLSSNPKYSGDIIKQTDVSTAYVGLNAKYGITSKVAVRRALEYAINKTFLVKILAGLALPANQVIPPSMPSGYSAHLPANASFSYNPTLARQLLAKAGYPHGFSIDLYIYSNPTQYNIAVALQQMFARVGVKVSIKSATLGVFFANAETGKLPMFLSSWGEDYPDPSDFLDTLFNSANAPAINNSEYDNSTVNALLNHAQVMPAGTARDNVYRQAQNIIMSQAAWIPTTWSVTTAAVQPWVKGFYINPSLYGDQLQYVWLIKH